MKKLLFIIFLSLIWTSLTLAKTETGKTPPANSNQAVKFYYSGQIQKSIETYQAEIPNNPDKKRALLNLIRLYQETGQYPKALTSLQELLHNEPQNPRIRLEYLKTAYLANKPKLILRQSLSPEAPSKELYWYALALKATGNLEAAIEAFQKSLSKSAFQPLAYYHLGQIYLQKKDFQTAKKAYQKALTQEFNLISAFFPLAQTYIALEEYPRAYRLLTNAQKFFPWNQKITTTLEKLVAEHPELEKVTPITAKKAREAVEPPQVTPISDKRSKIPLVKIGLAQKVSDLFIKTGGEFYIFNAQNQILLKSFEKAVIQIRYNPQKKYLEVLNNEGKRIFKSSSAYLTLKYNDPSLTTVLFNVQFGQGSYWYGAENRAYRGKMQFLVRNKKITVINQVNMEEYLYAVVPSEMSASWPRSALEAQAIAARTYAFANLGRYRKYGFDLKATVASQVYRGVFRERKRSTTAVNATRGKILLHNNKIISAFFSANCGGYSQSSGALWSINLPYLKPALDKLLPPRSKYLSPVALARWLSERPESYSSHPKYSARSAYRWLKWVSRSDLEGRLKHKGKDIGQIQSLQVISRSKTGLVSKIQIKGTKGTYLVKGDRIRGLFNKLRSNTFIFQPKMGSDNLPEYFIFHGAGWGHGIGLCQSGAAGMAADGYSHVEILKHYYQGTAIHTKY